MPPKVPNSARAVGVLGGLAGALLTGANGLATTNWLTRPLSDADALVVVLTLGTAILFAWAGVLLSAILFAISVHAVFDALGQAKGNSARRLAIVFVLILALVSAASIAEGELTPAGMALLVLGPIAALNIAATVLYGRAAKAGPDDSR